MGGIAGEVVDKVDREWRAHGVPGVMSSFSVELLSSMSSWMTRRWLVVARVLATRCSLFVV
eukprot:scaffold11970_cov112-Isochrysis_galbana.AAC.1